MKRLHRDGRWTMAAMMQVGNEVAGRQRHSRQAVMYQAGCDIADRQ
jgi:hypothetical protein